MVKRAIVWMLALSAMPAAAGKAEAHNDVPLNLPVVAAKAAVLIDGETGQLLFAKKPTKELPPASATKIMTGMLFARDLPPDKMVTISADSSSVTGDRLGMRSGERYTAADLLHAMLLISANDAATAAAEADAGSVSSFVKRMNREALHLGEVHTHFENPSGLPAPGHYSCAIDMASMARAALKVEAFAATVRMKTCLLIQPGSSRAIRLVNTNSLLWSLPGAIGVKTGHTIQAGYCFVGAARRRGRTLIAVLLNDPRWKSDAANLLNWGFQQRGLPPKPLPLPASSSQKTSAALPDFSQTGAYLPPSQLQEPSQPVIQNEQGMQKASSQRDATNLTTAPASQSGNFAGNRPVIAPAGTALDNQRFHQPAQADNAGIWSANHAALPSDEHRRTKPSLSNTLHQERNKNGIRSPYQSVNPASELKLPEQTSRRMFILFALFILACLLWYFRKLLRGVFKMPSFPFGASKKRKNQEQTTFTNTALAEVCTLPSHPVSSPQLIRIEGEEWLENLLKNPVHLLDDAVRSRACAIRSADTGMCEQALRGMLADTARPRLRIAAAELIHNTSIRRSEEALTEIMKSDSASMEIRTEAANLLAKKTDGRLERMWLETLLRDGFGPAARALVMIPQLEETTEKALLKTLQTSRDETLASDDIIRLTLRDANIACVLASHGLIDIEEATARIKKAPISQRDSLVIASLHGSSHPNSAALLLDSCLKGHAFPAMQALMECDPAQVRIALAEGSEAREGGERIRASILEWIAFGEGEEELIRQLGEAGNDLAVGALQFAKTFRWNPQTESPETLAAAAQIVSLKLGFSSHAPEMVAQAFRTVAVGEEGEDIQTEIPPELREIAKAYSNPKVHQAVKAAMYDEAGLEGLLGALCRKAETPAHRQELSFWSGKTFGPMRRTILEALIGAEEEEELTAIASRANDPDDSVRTAAQRALRWKPAPIVTTTPVEENIEVQRLSTLNQAA